jgi:hypothetical protein
VSAACCIGAHRNEQIKAPKNEWRQFGAVQREFQISFPVILIAALHARGRRRAIWNAFFGDAGLVHFSVTDRAVLLNGLVRQADLSDGALILFWKKVVVGLCRDFSAIPGSIVLVRKGTLSRRLDLRRVGVSPQTMSNLSGGGIKGAPRLSFVRPRFAALL